MSVDKDVVVYDIVRAHDISESCFICGTENQSGLHAQFLETTQGHLVGTVLPSQDHQSYPGRMHGGVSSAILDEFIGRAINISEPETWGVTVRLDVSYRKPVPLDRPLLVRAEIQCSNARMYEGIGEIVLEDGTIAVQAHGRYIKRRIDQIADADIHSHEIPVKDTRAITETFEYPTKSGLEITPQRPR